MDNEIKCNACKATFKKPENLNEDGLCEVCVRLGRSTKSKDEQEKELQTKENEGHIRTIVDKHVHKVLLDKGILIKCECGNSYYKRSPAQKKCGECKGETN